MINIDFGQGAAKIPGIKVGVRKKYLPTRLTRDRWVQTGQIGRYFFWSPTLTSGIFAAPWPKSIFSTTFERSTSYLFRDQSPKLLNDFNISNLGSKYPYFNRAYVVSGGFGCPHLYIAWLYLIGIYVIGATLVQFQSYSVWGCSERRPGFITPIRPKRELL